jgi:glycosyltransferase involved in cell wall biosynthesis
MPVPPVPVSDGVLEGLEPDLVHFPHQSAFLTKVHSIYHPHDLQHLHLPQFFTRREIAIRETQYRAFCRQAALVAMATTWGRDDILEAYRLPPEKVAVVALAPVIDRYRELSSSDLARLRQDLGLPEQFCFYPAQTWPHKNHERLLQAVAKLKAGGLVVPLVFSGAATSYRRHLEGVVGGLELDSQVRWVGFVAPSQLRGLYRLACCVVVPSLFESASQPVFEALSSGVAIACSNVNATPRQVGDAAVIFDPYSIDDIAGAIARLWNDPRLRQELVEKGRRRIAQFTWERTARHFAAYYRLLIQGGLSAEDRALIEAEPII